MRRSPTMLLFLSLLACADADGPVAPARVHETGAALTLVAPRDGAEWLARAEAGLVRDEGHYWQAASSDARFVTLAVGRELRERRRLLNEIRRKVESGRDAARVSPDLTFADETRPIDGGSAPAQFNTFLTGSVSSAMTALSPLWYQVRHRHTVRVTRNGTLVTNFDSGTFLAASISYNVQENLIRYGSDRDFGNECGATSALSYHTYTDIEYNETYTANSFDTRTGCVVQAPAQSPPPPSGGPGGGGEKWCLYYVVYTELGMIISQTEIYCWYT